ncbi:hypothetical protein [Streptomyces sp. NPDC048473]|uniref:hypothetical protein n=1 Tax=unclassified Streptomyces TaxID=2593676 RepID=UPI003711FE95
MRNAVTLAAKSLHVSKADLAVIAKAFDDHGIENGWERKGGTHDGTTIGADVLPAYEVCSGVDEQAARLAMKHGQIAWAGGDGRYVYVYDIAKGTTQTKRIDGFLFNCISDIRITSERVFWRETGGFLIPGTTFMSAPLDDLSEAAKLRHPSSTYVAQFSVNDKYLAYSTYGIWGALGSWSGPGKAQVSKTADVLAGLNRFSRVSCSSGAQLAPSLGDGRRVAWLDTSAAATDVVTRRTFAGTCE